MLAVKKNERKRRSAPDDWSIVEEPFSDFSSLGTEFWLVLLGRAFALLDKPM